MDPSAPNPSADLAGGVGALSEPPPPQIIDLGEALANADKKLGASASCGDHATLRPFDAEACKAALEASIEVSAALVESLEMMRQGFGESEKTVASKFAERWVAIADDAARETLSDLRHALKGVL